MGPRHHPIDVTTNASNEFHGINRAADEIVNFRVAFSQYDTSEPPRSSLLASRWQRLNPITDYEERNRMIELIGERYGLAIKKEMQDFMTIGFTSIVDQLDMMRRGPPSDQEMFKVMVSDEFLGYLKLLIQRAKMRDTFGESRARQVINEMPYYRMRHDNSRMSDDSEAKSDDLAQFKPEADDVILPEAPTIEIHTGDHRVVYRMLDPYRHAGDSLSNERMAQFVALHKQPEDTLYYVRQRGGWNQSFWVLLNPDEHRRLLGEIVKQRLSEDEDPLAKKKIKWASALRIVTIADSLEPMIHWDKLKFARFTEALRVALEEGDHDLIGHVDDIYGFCGNMKGVLDYIDEYIDEQDQVRMTQPAFLEAVKHAKTVVERGTIGRLLGDSILGHTRQ